jgi:hypothetical protein
MYSDNPQSVLTPNKGGTMTRNGKTTVIAPGQPTAGASQTRPMAPRSVVAPPMPRAAAAPQPAAAAGPMALGGVGTVLKPAAPRAAAPAAATPNAGGRITTQVSPNVRATVLKPATPAANTNPNRPNAGGTMVRGGVTTVVPPGQPTAASAVATRPAAPSAPARPPQVPNSAAPTPAAPVAATPPPKPPAAESLGFSSRGSMAPTGTDAAPGDANVGGTGLYSKRFSSPASAKIYDDYVNRLFGSAQPSKAPAAATDPIPTPDL